MDTTTQDDLYLKGFESRVEELAAKRKPKIGFGLGAVDQSVLDGLEKCKRWADITLVGPESIGAIDTFETIVSSDPESEIARLLVEGRFECIIRGTVDDFRTYEAYEKLMGETYPDSSIALFENNLKRRFFLACVSNPQDWSKEDRLVAARNYVRFAEEWQIPARVAVYTGVRHETYERKKEQTEGVVGILNKTYEDAEWIVAELKKDGLEAKNWAIDFDVALKEGYNIHVSVNGMVGNQMFRILTSCGGKILIGTRFGLPHCYEDNSRNETEWEFHVKWLAALINKKSL